jgi:hypothetical protein
MLSRAIFTIITVFSSDMSQFPDPGNLVTEPQKSMSLLQRDGSGFPVKMHDDPVPSYIEILTFLIRHLAFPAWLWMSWKESIK